MITPDKNFAELAQDYCNMPDLIPFDANKENALPYPIELLPKDVKQTVLSYQEYGQQPLPMIATSALATLSLACQGLINVARDEQLISPISLDIIIISDSGDRKTASDNFFSEPIRDWESNKLDELESEFKNCNADIMAHQLKKEGIKSKIKSKIANSNHVSILELQDKLRELEKNEPQKLILPKLFHEEVTPEALACSLATGYQSSSLWSNEAGIIVGSQAMRPEYLLKTITLLNRLWDGGVYRVDRKTSDNFIIEGRRLTCSLMMQPVVFNQFLNKCGDITRGSGFLARCLIVKPKSTMGTRFYKEPSKNINNQAFRQRILQLLDIPLPVDNKERLKPEILRLTSEAKKVWIEFYNETEAQLASGKEYEDIKDFASKAAENAARIAAIFHIFEDKKGLIDEETMRRACGIMAWYLSEIKCIMQNTHLSQQNEDAKILIDWILKNNFKVYKTADLLRNAPNKLRDKQRRDNAISVLESHNYITVCANEIIINPKCWSDADV